MYFAIVTLLSSLALASVAGWFSIVGFMTIYAGAPLYALVMGVVTECAKLVTASWLYRNWDYASWKIKAPLIYFTLALMTTTSIGVFGFLSKAHIDQGANGLDNAAKIETLNYQITREKNIIADNERVIAQLDSTVNSLLGKDRADRALAVRKSQQEQRKQLQVDSAGAQTKIDSLSKQKFDLESEVRSIQLEVGPIRYIAELLYGVEQDAGKNIESAVRLFTLLLVSTLDPLAVVLLIAANNTLVRLQDKKSQADVVPDTIDPAPAADKVIHPDPGTVISPAVASDMPAEPSISINDEPSSPADLIDAIRSATLTRPVAVVKTPQVTRVIKDTVDETSPEPWAQQTPVLRELLGTTVPIVREKQNKVRPVTPAENTDTCPKTLGWINVFNGDRNE